MIHTQYKYIQCACMYTTEYLYVREVLARVPNFDNMYIVDSSLVLFFNAELLVIEIR